MVSLEKTGTNADMTYAFSEADRHGERYPNRKSSAIDDREAAKP
jgi:hypothetical protein